LIGNMTRDPELRYTPSGTAVCSFSIATNRNWTTDQGEKKEDAEFHRIVAWNKLAELCSQFLVKGRKVYVEGRLQTRNWIAQDGTQRNSTEVVIDEMILLDSRRPTDTTDTGEPLQKAQDAPVPVSKQTEPKQKKEEKSETPKEEKDLPAGPLRSEASRQGEEEVAPDDIPF